MSFFGGSSTTTRTTNQQGTPEQDAQIRDYFRLVGDFTQGGPQQYFPHETIAPLTPEQMQAQQMALQFAQGGAQDIYGQLAGAGQAAAGFWNQANADPTQTPGFQGMVDYLTQRTNQNLTENVLPELRGGSVANNMYGGSRGALSAGLAGGRAQEGLTGTIAQMLNQAYNQQNQNALSAMGMAPGLAGAQAQAGLLPSQITAGVGEQNQAMDQALINAAIDRWNFEQNAPLQHLGQVQALQGNVGQYGGTTKEKTKTSSPFSFNQLLGTIGTIGSLFTPMGAAGAAMGAFGGMGGGGQSLGSMAGFGPMPGDVGSSFGNAALFPDAAWLHSPTRSFGS
jgi:hypothetical protein